MQVAIQGLACFYQGEFEQQDKTKIPYYQLGIVEVNKFGLNLVKVKLKDQAVKEALQLHASNVTVIAEMNIDNKTGKTSFSFLNGKIEAKKAA